MNPNSRAEGSSRVKAAGPAATQGGQHMRELNANSNGTLFDEVQEVMRTAWIPLAPHNGGREKRLVARGCLTWKDWKSAVRPSYRSAGEQRHDDRDIRRVRGDRTGVEEGGKEGDEDVEEEVDVWRSGRLMGKKIEEAARQARSSAGELSSHPD
jgi:hypothetical protein